MSRTTPYTPEQDAERLALCLGDSRLTPEAHMWGGVARFNCGVGVLTLLVEKGYCDPEQTQNDSPRVEDLLAFGQEHREWDVGFECYVVSNDRDDRRISVEAITLGTDNPLAMVEFMERWVEYSPDELTRNRAWWD